MTAPATAAGRGGGGASGRGSGAPQEGSGETITRRMVAELKGLHQPSREVGDILEAVLMVIDPQASYTWDEARKWLSDSRRFLKALQRATPSDVTPDTVRRLSAFAQRDYSGTHPTAFALAKWVVSLCERSADAGASTPTRRLLPDGSPARGAKRQRGVANVSSACVVLGACSALPALRLTATTAAVLQRSAKLWTQWCPVEGLPVYSFDRCVWGAKRELEMPVASAQDVYEQTAKRLVDSSREGAPSCLCLIGPASALYVYECFEHLLVDIASGGDGGGGDTDAGAGVAVSVLDVKDGIVRDAITDEETDGPEFLRDVRVVRTAQDLAALLEASPCHGSRVMSLAAASSPTLANPLCVAELDMTDSAGLTSVHSWAVAARTGASRLATHPLQRIAAAAFGLRGNVMLLAALPTTVAEAAAARAMHYTHLAVHEAEPWPDANKADADGNDEAGYGNPLDEARQDLNAIRKVALSQFRAIEPSPPVQAATMASLLCLGISTTSWDGCRTALCAPGLMRRLKEHEDVVTLLEADYRRLRALLRRCEALPLGATDSAEVVACGMALAQWASAAFAAGLVRQKKTRSVKDPRLPPPTLHSDSPALHDGDGDGAYDDAATAVTAVTAAAAATATEAASAADELATAMDHADAESSVTVSEPAAPPPPPTRARASSVAASSVAVGGGGSGAPSGAPTPALSALPLPLSPAEDAAALPHAESDEGAEALVGPLLARVSELEAELADKERLLVLLRHREEREEAARHKQGLSPPQPPPRQQATTPRGSVGNGAVRRQPQQPPPPPPPPAQAPRKERQQVTAAQTQQLRLKSWAAFVRTARREIGEAELLKVSYDMLHKLIRLYKLDRTPVEACRVELYWKEHNWKGEESFIPPVETRADRAQTTPRQKRTAVEGRDPRRCMHAPNAGPPRLPQPHSQPHPSSSSPANAAATAATSAAQRPPKSPRAPKVAARAQPIPQTPDTPGGERRRGRGSGGASPQRQGPPPPPATPASASVRTPASPVASPGSGRRGVHMTEIGELEQDAAVRRRNAPVGHADPNRMMAEHQRFNGASDEAAQQEVRRELCPYGSRAVLADPNAPSPAPKPRSLVRHTPAAASPADPNNTNAHASPKPTQRAMLPAQPAASCNPNPELGLAHHTDVCTPRTLPRFA